MIHLRGRSVVPLRRGGYDERPGVTSVRPGLAFFGGVQSAGWSVLPFWVTLLLWAEKDLSGGGERDLDCADTAREESSESLSAWFMLEAPRRLAPRVAKRLRYREQSGGCCWRVAAFPPASAEVGATSEVDVPVAGVEDNQLRVSPVGEWASISLYG